jgi:hypothetical protein
MTLWSRQGLTREITEEAADVLRKLPNAVDRQFVLPQAA